jgi:hypothetical protein
MTHEGCGDVDREMQRIGEDGQHRAHLVEVIEPMVGSDQPQRNDDRKDHPKGRRRATKKQRFDGLDPRLIDPS